MADKIVTNANTRINCDMGIDHRIASDSDSLVDDRICPDRSIFSDLRIAGYYRGGMDSGWRTISWKEDFEYAGEIIGRISADQEGAASIIHHFSGNNGGRGARGAQGPRILRAGRKG